MLAAARLMTGRCRSRPPPPPLGLACCAVPSGLMSRVPGLARMARRWAVKGLHKQLEDLQAMVDWVSAPCPWSRMVLVTWVNPPPPPPPDTPCW